MDDDGKNLPQTFEIINYEDSKIGK